MNYDRVAVLRGGPSDEYDLSLETGARAVNSLRTGNRFVKDIIVSRQGDWLYDGYAHTPHNILSDIDVVFIALHGDYSDDGQVLRTLNQLGMPYTGSGAFASATAFNKHLTKDILDREAIVMPKHLRIKQDAVADLNQIVYRVTQMFGPRYVLKPIASGSSLGVQYVGSQAELLDSLLQGFVSYDEIIVEEYIDGKHVTMAVIENFRDEPYYTSPVVESVLPNHSLIFTNDLKTADDVYFECPARLSDTEKQAVRDTAITVHRALGLEQYSRSDFVVSPSGVYFLEVNTRPALTPTSSMETALTSIGSSYDEFIEQLISNAKRSK